MKSLYVRSLTSDDYEQWRGLYQGYADFYHVALTKDGVQTTWSCLIYARHVCFGGVAAALIKVVQARGQGTRLRRCALDHP